jgi:type II restriction enzyme
MYLLSRGKNAADSWSLEHPFEEKQNDTADIIVVHDNHFELIDVKTRNLTKKSQPPNIVSAYKLARLFALIIDNRDCELLSIHYVELGWRPIGDSLICETGSHTELFKINPYDLYINWATAMQIQFDVSEIMQTFEKPTFDWPREYIRHFVEQARPRFEDMIGRFVHPFEKYL